MAGVRPRYGRLAAFGAAVAVTGTAVLGGTGALPTGPDPAYASSGTGSARPADSGSADGRPPGERGAMALAGRSAPVEADVPARSGEGRRVVFDASEQRVWLVGRGGRVLRSYPVSGSLHDNLDPGGYAVYSRSRDAIGVDGSTMEYMVRFAHGENAAIGFHDIPLMRGRLVQTTAQLGTPLSHGCIRQAEADARAMWRFARIGTPVVVTA